MNNKKYKKYTEFKDPIHNITFGVVILNANEMRKDCEERGSHFSNAYFNGENNNFIFYKTNPGLIAHEAFHGLEFTLFQQRNYNINLECFNEHLAYYLAFLVENIAECLELLTKK